MRTLGDQALADLGEWTRSHWGEEVQLLSSEEEAGGSDPGTNATATEQAPRPVRVRDAEEAGDTRETGLSMDDDAMAIMPDGDSGAASSTTPFTRPEGPDAEPRRRRRSFTSPSSLDNDD